MYTHINTLRDILARPPRRCSSVRPPREDFFLFLLSNFIFASVLSFCAYFVKSLFYVSLVFHFYVVFHIYIYIYVHAYVYVHVYVYIYIYIYTHKIQMYTSRIQILLRPPRRASRPGGRRAGRPLYIYIYTHV